MRFYSHYDSPEDLDLFLEELETLQTRCNEFMPTDIERLTDYLDRWGAKDTHFVEAIVDCYHIVRHGQIPSYERGLQYRDEFREIACKLYWTTHNNYWNQVSWEEKFAIREGRYCYDYGDTDPAKDRLTAQWYACAHVASSRRDAWLHNPILFINQFARDAITHVVKDVSGKMVHEFTEMLREAPAHRRNQAIEKYWSRFGGYYQEERYSTAEYRALEYRSLFTGHLLKMEMVRKEAERLTRQS